MTIDTGFEFENELKEPIDGTVRAYTWGKERFALKETACAWIVTDSPISLTDDVSAQLANAPDE